MFADRETMALRAEKAAAEWAKAKLTWRRFSRVLLGVLVIFGFFLAYSFGYLDGQLASARNKPESVSTP